MVAANLPFGDFDSGTGSAAFLLLQIQLFQFMSKSPLPNGNQPVMPQSIIPKDAYRAAQLTTFFDELLGIAGTDRKQVFNRLENAVQGKSVADAVFAQSFLANLFCCLLPETAMLHELSEYYRELSEKEVLPC